MIKKVLSFVVGAILIVGGAQWLAKPGNGKSAGQTSGKVASTGVDAVSGGVDVISGFVSGLSK